MAANMEAGSSAPKEDRLAAVRSVLQQNRQFLDFFWDIAKPDQEVRLKATENLIEHLKSSEKEDELKYTFKRLVDGLAATREAARPGFSLALAQVVQCFEEIPLTTVFEYIDEKYNLQKAKKKLLRNAAFGNFFGVLALFQSGRLSKDTKVLLQCVQLLQTLAQFRDDLKDLPRKTLVDILSEISESTFQEVLFEALRSDLTSAFSTPEQLHLLLVGMQKFPGVLKPKNLKKLLGSSKIVTEENIPKLVDLLKMAAKSVKKDKCLPAVGLDVVKISLKEDAFELFWKEVVENGLMEEQFGPCVYMSYRLLGASLPLLDKNQLQLVLRSKVMLHYGNHIVSNQPIDRFKFSPEMNTYVDAFLENCEDAEKQLKVLMGFSLLTNQGYPVVPSTWKVVSHLKPSALQKYIDWLKNMFISPDLDSCLDFSTKRQQEKQEQELTNDQMVLRLRKWIIPRLTSIVDNSQVKKDEDQVMDIARFILFHAFFEAKKSASDIPETEMRPTIPLDDKIRAHVADAFFSLLLNLNNMPALGESSADNTMKERHIVGFTADGSLWIHCMVRYANLLLSREKVVKAVKPFGEEEKNAWERMLQYVQDLQKKQARKKSNSMELSAYQQLLLLVGIHLFKTPAESIDLLNDIHNCLEKAVGKKAKKKKESEGEPEWVEVMVEILLSLFSQPSKLFRVVARNVFKMICPFVTKNALQLILNVFDPEEEQSEESAIVVTDEKDHASGDEDEESSCDEDSAMEDDQDEDNKESENEEELAEDVNQVFRKQLMDVLHAGKAMEGDDSDEDLDDETMMALDENLSTLFSEHKKRIQAKKDEKAKMRQEKNLRRDFKTKVLDLIDVFVKKQSDSPLVFNIMEPLISVIERSMSSDSNQQEQDFLRKTADIFMNDLCKNKHYCKDVSHLKDDLHDIMEKFVKRAAKQTDSSVALYCFRGSKKKDICLQGCFISCHLFSQVVCMGCVDLQRVTEIYQESLKGFMTKRNSPLTAAMFLDLFSRFPFICRPLLGIIIKSIRGGARQHQQAQACTLLLKSLQNLAQTKSVDHNDWVDLINQSLMQLTLMLEDVETIKVKVDQEKLIKCFELLNYLIKVRNQQDLDISLASLLPILVDLQEKEGFGKPVRLEDMYWNVMKLLGFTRPKKEKTKVTPVPASEGNALPKKKKGVLPESKKRKNRKKGNMNTNNPANKEENSEGQQPGTKSKKKKKKKRKTGQQEDGAKENIEGAPATKKRKPNEDARGKVHTAKPEKTTKKLKKPNHR
ncbi:myb-binding protein 1A [Pyxicephalus adspersus]|uniref:myb-binding protein 1A n=1 Tax=Pyxicephalus adspersus TaxID=30357 RepID=UPI003B594FCA